MNNIIFLTVSAMDRIKGAQDHFGKGITSGKIVIITIAITIVVGFIIFGIIQSRKSK